MSHDAGVTRVLQRDVLPCPRAAQAVTVNEFVGRGARDSSNQASSRCCSCDRFVAGSAIIAFSGGLGISSCTDNLPVGSRTLKPTYTVCRGSVRRQA